MIVILDAFDLMLLIRIYAHQEFYTCLISFNMISFSHTKIQLLVGDLGDYPFLPRYLLLKKSTEMKSGRDH